MESANETVIGLKELPQIGTNKIQRGKLLGTGTEYQKFQTYLTCLLGHFARVYKGKLTSLLLKLSICS